jgi:hypothetical protein
VTNLGQHHHKGKMGEVLKEIIQSETEYVGKLGFNWIIGFMDTDA